MKISLLLGDNHSKTAIEAVKEIEKAYPGVKGKVKFQVLTSKAIRDRETDIKEIAASKTVFILLIMDRQAVEKVKPHISEVIKNGGRVYAVGGTYTKEHKDMGLIDDVVVKKYYKENGLENIKNMILFVMNRDLSFDVKYKEPVQIPDFGIYLKGEKRIAETIEEYLKRYHVRQNRPWIGITFYKSIVDSGNTAHLDFLIDSLEEGFNVLPVYGYPSEAAVERFFFDERGKSRVNAVVGMSLKMGLNPQIAIPLLSRLNVPVIDAITLYSQSKEEWEKSPVGLDIFERSFQIALPEMGGIIQPTVIASKEKAIDKETGIEYIEERPIPERIKRLVERVKAWVNLQEKANKDKRVAVIYYNYPPGKQNIGASYLNVLPESLWEILQRLGKEGYSISSQQSAVSSQEMSKERLFNDIHNYARNIGNWAGGEIDRLARSSKPILIPIETYKAWFEELPEGFKKAVIKNWG
ncbi:MAG: cobaltochelatase subunit CobN, partial [Nitrospirae bacterium]|nr:cobaltochelatase subunit CobN [Nitrospirota bacterium]